MPWLIPFAIPETLEIFTALQTTAEHLVRFCADESGQDMIEYVLLAGLIALTGIATMPTLSGRITESFTHVGTQLSSAM